MKKIAIFFPLLIVLFIIKTNYTYAFYDVPDNMYYSEAVYDLSKRGIVNGTPDGNFYPNDNVTRGQAAKIVASVLQLPLNHEEVIEFKDVPNTHYFAPYIQSLVAHRYMNGYSNQLFGINDPMTREQVAKFLVTAFQLPIANTINTPFTDISNSYAKDEIATLYAYGVTNGIESTKYGTTAPITRGSIAVLIQKLEKIKAQHSVVINYQDQNAQSAEVKYEYINAPEYVAVHLDEHNEKLLLTPLKEGRTTLVLHLNLPNGEKKSIKYELLIELEQGNLSTNIIETKTIEAAQFTYEKSELTFKPTSIIVTTSTGSTVNNVDIDMQDDYVITFYDVGNYFITFKDDAGKIQQAFVALTQKDFVLIGDAIWTDGTLLLTEEYLPAPVESISFSLIKDDSKTVPVTVSKTPEGLLIKALSEGSTYLQIKSNTKQFNNIIEVTKEYGYYVIDVYEVN